MKTFALLFVLISSVVATQTARADYEVSKIENQTNEPIHFSVRWGNQPWQSQRLLPGRQLDAWNNILTEGYRELWITFDSDMGPGVNMKTFRLRTYTHPSSVLNGPPTEVFRVNGQGVLQIINVR